MEYYDEYPILCKQSGTPIGKYAKKFLELCGAGMKQEDALNELRKRSLCCRHALMSPVCIYHNMECSESVAGIVDPKSAQPDLVKLVREDVGPGSQFQGLSGTAIPISVKQTDRVTSEEHPLDEPRQVGVSIIKDRSAPTYYKNIGDNTWVRVPNGRLYIAG